MRRQQALWETSTLECLPPFERYFGGHFHLAVFHLCETAKKVHKYPQSSVLTILSRELFLVQTLQQSVFCFFVHASFFCLYKNEYQIAYSFWSLARKWNAWRKCCAGVSENVCLSLTRLSACKRCDTRVLGIVASCRTVNLGLHHR